MSAIGAMYSVSTANNRHTTKNKTPVRRCFIVYNMVDFYKKMITIIMSNNKQPKGLNMIGMSTLFLVTVVVVFYVIAVYNNLIAQKNQVKEAWATVDTQLKRRYDLIPNLIEVVRNAAKVEKETLTAVIDARNAAMKCTGPDGADAQNKLTETLKTLFAVSESYPILKSNQNFLELQRELVDTENKIQATRQFYNTVVMRFNTRVEQFPSNVIANMFNIKSAQLFQAAETEREAPQVKF